VLKQERTIILYLEAVEFSSNPDEPFMQDPF